VEPGAEAPAGPIPMPPPAETPGWTKWFNPETAPFIPVPLIDVDPNGGTTVGLIPVLLHTDENHNIRRIIAPDIVYNPYFGVGVHARVFAYSTVDEQWSLVAGIKERVEREFDAEYQIGRLREDRWSINYSLIYDRDGTPRFYGIGNHTPARAETNYTSNQALAQIQIGLNFNPIWQLLYTARFQVIDVLPGTLSGVASIETRFPEDVGTDRRVLNRLAIVYDSRDDLTVPTHGMKWSLYVGAAAKDGVLNGSLYTEGGIDGRGIWPISGDTVLAAHVALQYLSTARDVPFWALSTIGGGQSEIGGEQPLRGFGAGRFYDRDSFSTTVELRRKLVTFDAVATNLDIEIAPFIDVGRVMARASDNPVDHLHPVFGVGFRGIARPFVVGYVDIGFGSEGPAVFTGLNYPF
jgi:outer membrane protein assembly factor BamA